MQKCQVFKTTFWQTLQIAYRLDCDDEVAAQFREGLKRVKDDRPGPAPGTTAYNTEVHGIKGMSPSGRLRPVSEILFRISP